MTRITRTMRRPLLAALIMVVTTRSVHGTAIHPKHRRRHLAGDNNKNNNNNNNNNMSPKEKDVIANPICSTEALTAADISGNDFISRAEYVNLLLDLAPPDCPIIDMWLNQDALKQTFEKLSCLCHEFGGIDGENNCCLQAVSVPMLAAFATPNSYYPQEYSAQACAMIDQVLVQHCPKTVAPTPAPTKTESPTTIQPTDPPKGKPNDNDTTNNDIDIGLSVTTFETAVPSTAPSMSPTPDETLELTQAGELVEVVIEDGQVTTTTVGEEEDEEDNNLDSKPTEVPEEEEDIPEEEAFIQDDDEAAGSNDNSDNDNKDPTTTSELPDPSSPTLEETEEPPADGSDLLEGVLDGSDSNQKEPEHDHDWTLQQQGEQQQQQQQQGASGNKETPVGILLSALLVITFLIALALLAIWGKRRGLMENPWKRPTEMTVNTASSDDIETPRRSNTRRSQSFDDDDEDDDDSQSDEDGALTDDDDEDGDEETGPRRKGGGSKSVVRAEFQDDLSVWGRRKRRRQERKQRREERQRQSLEQNPPQHQNTITTILSTLEFDLSGGGGGILANNGGGGVGANSIRPNSTKSMGSMRSSMGGSVHTTATNTAAKENMVDIFDDKSDTSSYDGSPEHLDGAMPLETSIEDWLDHVQQQGKSRINADGSIVHDDRSVMSHISTTSKKSTTSSRRSNSMSPDKKPPRQPRDPSLQDWHTQRQQLNAASSSIPRLDYNKFSQPAGVAPYNLNSTRSYSPARSAQRSSISSSSSYSPSQSPKPTYLLTSVSFSPASSPKSLRPFAGSASRSEPASPVEKVVVLQQETTLSLASSSSSASRKEQDESKDSDSPLVALKSVSVTPSSGDWNPLQLDLPVEHTHHSHSSSPSSTIPPPPRLSPESQEFYETVLRMEPPDEDDERHRGNAFAFEAVRPRNTPAPERYLV